MISCHGDVFLWKMRNVKYTSLFPIDLKVACQGESPPRTILTNYNDTSYTVCCLKSSFFPMERIYIFIVLLECSFLKCKFTFVSIYLRPNHFYSGLVSHIGRMILHIFIPLAGAYTGFLVGFQVRYVGVYDRDGKTLILPIPPPFIYPLHTFYIYSITYFT